MNTNQTIQKAIEIAGNQQKLASLTGIRQASISKLLMGKSKDIRLSTAQRISEVTGISLQEISDSYKSPPPCKLIKK